MANTKEITDKKLRHHFAAKTNPQLVARAEYVTVKMVPLTRVYADQDVLAAGKDADDIPAFVCDKASAKEMYPYVLSNSETENVEVDKRKIDRMSTISLNVSQNERGG